MGGYMLNQQDREQERNRVICLHSYKDMQTHTHTVGYSHTDNTHIRRDTHTQIYSYNSYIAKFTKDGLGSLQ